MNSFFEKTDSSEKRRSELGSGKMLVEAPDAPEPYYEAPISLGNPRYAYDTAAESKNEPTICGLRRVTFICCVIIAILGILATTAAALAGTYAHKAKVASQNGAVASLSESQTSALAAAASTRTSTIQTAAPTTLTTSTSKTQSPSSTTSTSMPTNSNGVEIECLAANGTTYTSGSFAFLKLCATEHTPQKGSTDLGSVKANTMEDCIAACVRHTQSNGADGKCVGVNWITRQAQGVGNSACWLKGKLGGVENWDGCEAAVLLDVPS